LTPSSPPSPPSRLLLLLVTLVPLLPLGAGCANKGPSFEDVLPPDELFAEAQEILAGRKIAGIVPWTNYGKAIDTFQAIIDNYPYSDYALESELLIADAYYDDGRYDEALSYYRDFGDLHPEHERVPYTVLRSALCRYNQIQSVERDQTPTREALIYLERLVEEFPFSEEAREGERVLRELRTRLAGNLMRIGDFYLRRDEFQAAASRYREILNTYPGLGRDAESLFKLGVCYQNMRRYDEALRLFYVVVENYRETELALAAAERIAAGN
jgi:outer membrane protein assembly factor BamD